MWLGKQESLRADLQNIEELHEALLHDYQEREGWSLSLGGQVTRSMDTFLSMPYFSRSWITQEIVVSRNPVINFGTGKLGFDGIASTFRLVHRLQPGVSTQASEFVSLDNIRRAIQDIQKTQHATSKVDGNHLEDNSNPSHDESKGPYILPELTSLLIFERDKGATDARDKVYALLGINGIAGCCQFSPDYTTTTNELYIAVASQLIQQSNGLRILSSSQPRYSTRNLPSWVPDWSQPWRGGIDRRDNFSSGRSFDPRICVNSENNSLSLYGARVDTVRRMVNVRLMDWEYTDIIDPLASILQKEAGKLGVRRQWFCNNEPGSLLLQVLVAGRGPFVMSKDLNWFKGFSNTGEFEMNPYNVHKRRWDRFRHNLAWVENEWDMFETSNGYVGLAPTSILPGDIVWILGGGNVPFILRQRTQGGYELIGDELIGECYLYGFMQDCVEIHKAPAEKIIIW
ncbi:hypothetical protein FGADI_4310 [Fusarium gaditjirri]|uniref:Heterokaryon incompatibility domain-containing protein n=1 Tax=Fusarium gaditjirri TaxID=282569 RepID=A0A8H4TDF7_9HYPO|nr:hypothetical protein FGADI_4310 [Fusarium gaditjirri]